MTSYPWPVPYPDKPNPPTVQLSCSTCGLLPDSVENTPRAISLASVAHVATHTPQVTVHSA